MSAYFKTLQPYPSLILLFPSTLPRYNDLHSSAKHSPTFISLQMLLLLPKTLTFPKPLSTVTSSQKAFPNHSSLS